MSQLFFPQASRMIDTTMERRLDDCNIVVHYYCCMRYPARREGRLIWDSQLKSKMNVFSNDHGQCIAEINTHDLLMIIMS